MVFPLGEVRTARIVHAQVGSLPVVLVAAEENLPVVAYDRRLNDRALTFTLADTRPAALRDVETGTVWPRRSRDSLIEEAPRFGCRDAEVRATEIGQNRGVNRLDLAGEPKHGPRRRVSSPP